MTPVLKKAQRDKKPAKRAKPLPKGTAFELQVASIQAALDPNSKVTHNEKIVDKVGIARQCDVVVRGALGGRQVLGIIEARDHAKRTGLSQVEAFAKKCENLNANLRVIVSRSGFTPNALKLAEREGVGCLSLAPNGDPSVGFALGSYWYGRVRTWRIIRVGATPIPEGFDPTQGLMEDILFEGRPIVNWFFRELVTKHQEFEDPVGILKVDFPVPVSIDYGGTPLRVDSVFCEAERTIRHKRRWVTWSANAFYDWHAQTLTIPPDGYLVGGAISPDVSLWPDHDRPAPAVEPPATGVSIQLGIIWQQKWTPAWDDTVPDLSQVSRADGSSGE